MDGTIWREGERQALVLWSLEPGEDKLRWSRARSRLGNAYQPTPRQTTTKRICRRDLGHILATTFKQYA